MVYKKFISSLLLSIGIVSLFIAAAFFGLGLYESTVIPASRFKDHAVGHSIIIPLSVIGLVAVFSGLTMRTKGNSHL